MGTGLSLVPDGPWRDDGPPLGRIAGGAVEAGAEVAISGGQRATSGHC